MDNKVLQELLRGLYEAKSKTTRLAQGWVCKTELGRMLNKSYFWVADNVRSGLIPPPTHFVGKRKYWTANEADSIVEVINQLPHIIKGERKPLDNPWTQKGHYNVSQAAEYLGMPVCTYQTWRQKGQVPQPSHLGPGGFYYYTKAELDQIKRDNYEYFRARKARAKGKGN